MARWWSTSLFALRDRDVVAVGDATEMTVRERACLTRQIAPDRAQNPVFDLRSGNAHDRSGLLPASR